MINFKVYILEYVENNGLYAGFRVFKEIIFNGFYGNLGG